MLAFALLLLAPLAFAGVVPSTISEPQWQITELDLTFAGPNSKANTTIAFTIDRGSGTAPVHCQSTWWYDTMLLTRNSWDWVWCDYGDFSFAFINRTYFAGWHIVNRIFNQTAEFYIPEPWNMTIHLDQYRFYTNETANDNSMSVYHNYAEPLIHILKPGDPMVPSSVQCTGGDPLYHCTLPKSIDVDIIKQNDNFQPIYLVGVQTKSPKTIVYDQCYSPLSFQITIGKGGDVYYCSTQDCPSEYYDTCMDWSLGTGGNQYICSAIYGVDIMYSIQPHDPNWTPACHGGPPDTGFDLYIRSSNRYNNSLYWGDWISEWHAVEDSTSVFSLTDDMFDVSCDNDGCNRTVKAEPVPFAVLPQHDIWGAVQIPPTP